MTRATWLHRIVFAGMALIPALRGQQLHHDLDLFAKGIGDKRVYVNHYITAAHSWTGWSEVPGGAMTKTGLAAASFPEKQFLFAVDTDNQILINSQGPCNGWTGWTKAPGGMNTDVAVAATTFGNKLLLFAKGMDSHIWTASSLDGKAWSNWKQLPGTTDVSPAVTVAGSLSQAGTVYLFAKGIGNSHIYVSKSTDATSWSPWQDVGGVTDVALGATTVTVYQGGFGGPITAKNTIYLFGKGIADKCIYVNKSTDGNSWTGWNKTGGVTDVAVAPFPEGSNGLIFFSKGIADHRIYLNYSADGTSWAPWSEVAGGGTTDAALAVALPPACIK